MAIFTGKDRSLVIEGHLIVVFNSRELLVSDLQSAFREIIHLQKRPSQGVLVTPSKPFPQCNLPTVLTALTGLMSAPTHRGLTLFTSMRGKNLSTCSLKAVALISPCKARESTLELCCATLNSTEMTSLVQHSSVKRPRGLQTFQKPAYTATL